LVASSSDGNRLVAAAYAGQIYTSADAGMTWSPHGPTPGWLVVASSSDGSRLAAVIGSGQVYLSGDYGTTWTQNGPMGTWRSVASSSDGTRLLAGSFNGHIYTSGGTGMLVAHSSSSVGVTFTGSDTFFLSGVAGSVTAP
jgi:photosystem II stability/assembly factor-like uncharacterized protein